MLTYNVKIWFEPLIMIILFTENNAKQLNILSTFKWQLFKIQQTPDYTTYLTE